MHLKELTIRLQTFYKDLYEFADTRHQLLASGKARGKTAPLAAQLAKRESDKALELSQSDDLGTLMGNLEEAKEFLKGDHFTDSVGLAIVKVQPHVVQENRSFELLAEARAILTIIALHKKLSGAESGLGVIDEHKAVEVLPEIKEPQSPWMKAKHTQLREEVQIVALDKLLEKKKNNFLQMFPAQAKSSLLLKDLIEPEKLEVKEEVLPPKVQFFKEDMDIEEVIHRHYQWLYRSKEQEDLGPLLQETYIELKEESERIRSKNVWIGQAIIGLDQIVENIKKRNHNPDSKKLTESAEKIYEKLNALLDQVDVNNQDQASITVKEKPKL